jgi:hypothetical protein
MGAARIGPVALRLDSGLDRARRPHAEPGQEWSREGTRSPPAAYLIDYVDGTQATLLMLDGALADFNFAARVRGMSEPFSCQLLLPPVSDVAYSACLMHQVETMIESGRAPYPVERTLLVSGVLENCLDSKLQARRRLDPPTSPSAISPRAARAFAGAERACGHRPDTDGSSAKDRV